MVILSKIETHYKQKLPFVVYRKPNESKVSALFCKSYELYYSNNYRESGFVFAPFNKSKKSILFPLEKSEYLYKNLIFKEIDPLKLTFSQIDNSKEQHVNLVEKTIEEIKKSSIKKVVVSRKEELQLTNFDIITIYQKLLDKYKKAFVYVWYHPKIGLWFGATPETLVEIENNFFKTMSLAGTQVDRNSQNIFWGKKEIEEQQLVTNFIENQLAIICEKLFIEKAKTVKAGSLLHLKSKIEGELKENFYLQDLIDALHPTPAVCGLPRAEAKKFILENENYDRSYYTGFLGEINISSNKKNIKRSHLFVNLRCMNIEGNNANVYVGGGITKDSNAKKEWEETVSKTETMKTILK